MVIPGTLAASPCRFRNGSYGRLPTQQKRTIVNVYFNITHAKVARRVPTGNNREQISDFLEGENSEAAFQIDVFIFLSMLDQSTLL